MKKPTVTIELSLPRPYDGQVPAFALKKTNAGAIGIPTFEANSLEVVQDFYNLAHHMLLKEPILVFWGLSGNLGCYFSKVKDKDLTIEQVRAKITLAKPMQPFSVIRQGAFDLMVDRLGGAPSVKEIAFEEAMLVVEGKKQPPVPDYEEPEDAEFDDECTPECRPGDHKCGKKNV